MEYKGIYFLKSFSNSLTTQGLSMIANRVDDKVDILKIFVVMV
jgi:hypothetical protein